MPLIDRRARETGARILVALLVCIVVAACVVASEESSRRPASPAAVATTVRVPQLTPEVTRVATAAIGATTPIPPGAEVARSPLPEAARPGRYVVQQGDTLLAISRRFGVPAAELAAPNQLPADAQLRTGQELRLPGGIWSDGLAIRVTAPAPGAIVRSPFSVEGTAATFESRVVVEVLGADDGQLARAAVTSTNPDLGLHGPFRATLNVPAAAQKRPVTVRLYWTSPRDGTPRDDIRIPVTLASS
jgi:LysM repeat protein